MTNRTTSRNTRAGGRHSTRGLPAPARTASAPSAPPAPPTPATGVLAADLGLPGGVLPPDLVRDILGAILPNHVPGARNALLSVLADDVGADGHGPAHTCITHLVLAERLLAHARRVAGEGAELAWKDRRFSLGMGADAARAAGLAVRVLDALAAHAAREGGA